MRTLISLTSLVLCYLLSACQHTASEAGYQAIGKYSKNANKEWGWELSGIGGQFGNNIQRFNIDYNVTKEVNIEEARKFIVQGVSKFLEYVNNNDKTRSFLIEEPFPQTRLKFGLGFVKPDGLFVDQSHIAYALLLDGVISYNIKLPHTICLKEIYEETYEEALAIVRNEEAKAIAEPSSSAITQPLLKCSVEESIPHCLGELNDIGDEIKTGTKK